MIEVEKKFSAPQNIINLLKDDSTFISSKIINDIYCDFPDYRLVKKDWWLRFRNGVAELKISKNTSSSNEGFDIYDEITDEFQIKKMIETEDFNDLQEIVNLTTKRDEYKFNEFSIVFDEAVSNKDDFMYNLIEVETMAENEDSIQENVQKIRDFAKNYGIQETKIIGKVSQYLYEKNREIYELPGRK